MDGATPSLFCGFLKWKCSCGAITEAAEETCHVCHAPKRELYWKCSLCCIKNDLHMNKCESCEHPRYETATSPPSKPDTPNMSAVTFPAGSTLGSSTFDSTVLFGGCPPPTPVIYGLPDTPAVCRSPRSASISRTPGAPPLDDGVSTSPVNSLQKSTPFMKTKSRQPLSGMVFSSDGASSSSAVWVAPTPKGPSYETSGTGSSMSIDSFGVSACETKTEAVYSGLSPTFLEPPSHASEDVASNGAAQKRCRELFSNVFESPDASEETLKRQRVSATPSVSTPHVVGASARRASKSAASMFDHSPLSQVPSILPVSAPAMIDQQNSPRYEREFSPNTPLQTTDSLSSTEQIPPSVGTPEELTVVTQTDGAFAVPTHSLGGSFTAPPLTRPLDAQSHAMRFSFGFSNVDGDSVGQTPDNPVVVLTTPNFGSSEGAGDTKFDSVSNGGCKDMAPTLTALGTTAPSSPVSAEDAVQNRPEEKRAADAVGIVFTWGSGTFQSRV